MKDISKATKANWLKLNVEFSDKKLDKRANKRMSTKNIIPKELFINKENIDKVMDIVEIVKPLRDKFTIKEIMYNLALIYLLNNGLIDRKYMSNKKSIKTFLNDNIKMPIIDKIKQIKLPNDEIDILGIIYQCLLTEGSKNQSGSYYTPNCIVKNMLKKVVMRENNKVLDPCCGTGMFLLGIRTKNPQNIYGIDFDEIAVMICKINLIVKYKHEDFEPNIFRYDFIRETPRELSNIKFDYIITNPPWGSNLDDIDKKRYLEITSGESFSYVLYNAINMCAEKGKVLFLLPESFLNVKVHSDIRKYILENMSFKEIIKYPTSFSGVVTKYISICLENNKRKTKKINIYDFKNIYFENVLDIRKNPNFVITINEQLDKEILRKVYNREYETLEKSTWALGIVTGNNKEKLKQIKTKGLEEIYTGKEIEEYRLMTCRNYIEYNRSNFQQVAPDNIYRAEEKLVYKFISKKITFAYDNKKRLVLNSANILIPNIKGMSIKTAMAFLNSNLFQYLYIKKFGEIKILRGNLSQLPFPKLSNKQNNEFEELVDNILNGKEEYKRIVETKIYELFNITDEEVKHIEVSINGKTDEYIRRKNKN